MMSAKMAKCRNQFAIGRASNNFRMRRDLTGIDGKLRFLSKRFATT